MSQKEYEEQHEGHEQHLCHLFNLRMLQDQPKEYRALVKDAKFICIGCGRVAASADNLCAPRPLEDEG